MTIWQGTFYSQLFMMKDCCTNVPINITGWEFHAQFRLETEDPTVLLELTSAAGEFVVHDAPNGLFSMQIQPADTVLLPEDMLHFDVLRTAPLPGPVMLFWGRVPVQQPVTRNG